MVGGGRGGRESPFRFNRLVILVGLGVALYFAASFANLALTGYRLSLRASHIQGEIAVLQREYQRLQSEVAYLQTDAAVEKLAREDLGWAKPGETAIILVWPPGWAQGE